MPLEKRFFIDRALGIAASVQLLAGCARIEQTLGIPEGRGLTDGLIIAAFAFLIFLLNRRGRRRKPGHESRKSARPGRRRRGLPYDEREGGQDGGDSGE